MFTVENHTVSSSCLNLFSAGGSLLNQTGIYELHPSPAQVPQAVKDQYADPPNLLPRHGLPQYLLPPPFPSDLEASTATTVPAITTASRETPITSSTAITTAAATTIATTTAPNMRLTQRLEVKEEPAASPVEEGKDISEVLKTEDKRSETERKTATKEEIDEVCFPI